jgi:hypothetical protein
MLYWEVLSTWRILSASQGSAGSRAAAASAHGDLQRLLITNRPTNRRVASSFLKRLNFIDHIKAVRRTRNVTWLKTSHVAKRQTGEVTARSQASVSRVLAERRRRRKW